MNIHYTDSTADLRWQMKQSVYSTREQEKLSILKKKKPEGKNTEKKNEKNLRGCHCLYKVYKCKTILFAG